MINNCLKEEIQQHPEIFPVIAQFWEIDALDNSIYLKKKNPTESSGDQREQFYKNISKLLNFNAVNYEI